MNVITHNFFMKCFASKKLNVLSNISKRDNIHIDLTKFKKMPTSGSLTLRGKELSSIQLKLNISFTFYKSFQYSGKMCENAQFT